MEGIEIDCIAGTSVGSLVGAAYAAGLRGDHLLETALEARWRHIARLVWPRHGFFAFDKLESYLIGKLGDLTFDDLKIPYAAMTADLDTGEQVVVTRGRVAPAVRASCSVPGIVTPVDMDGRRLVDGGIVNNLPISVVREMGAEIVIAVGLVVPGGDRPQNPLQIGLRALECLLLRAADDPATADVYLPIPLRGISTLVRTSARHRFIATGRRVAEEALPAIRAAID
jgi:NTE family protein